MDKEQIAIAAYPTGKSILGRVPALESVESVPESRLGLIRGRNMEVWITFGQARRGATAEARSHPPS